MAHRVLGIDLGSYSVKVAELSAGFRQTLLTGVYEKTLLPPTDDSEAPLHRAVRTLRALLDEEGIEPEVAAASLGRGLTLRVMHLPFADRKTLDTVVPGEFEGVVLGDAGEMNLDVLVGHGSARGNSVLAVAARISDLQQLVDEMASVRCEPRIIGAAPVAAGALVGIAIDKNETAAVVDIGHRQTHISIVDRGRVVFARTVRRGGADVTRALQDTYRMTEDDADRSKHEQAFVLSGGEVGETEQHRRVDECVKAALRPLLRELRQTLSAVTSEVGCAVQKLYLTGGGARLRGLVPYLGEELKVPAAVLTIPRNNPLVAAVFSGDEEQLAAQLPLPALAAAMQASISVEQVNLRKGALAYRTDYSYLRQKAAPLAIGMMFVLLSAGLNAWVALRSLREEGTALEERLKRETQELFGEPKLDGKAVSEELRQGPRGGVPPIPQATALDILEMLTKAVPTDGGKLDVLELDIKSKKIFLKATAESAAQIDALSEALSKVDCFDDVQKGKVSSVPIPASAQPATPPPPKPVTPPAPPGTPGAADADKDKDKAAPPTDYKQFSLTIETKCN